MASGQTSPAAAPGNNPGAAAGEQLCSEMSNLIRMSSLTGVVVVPNHASPILQLLTNLVLGAVGRVIWWSRLSIFWGS
jgi:hypothetical protein